MKDKKKIYVLGVIILITVFSILNSSDIVYAEEIKQGDIITFGSYEQDNNLDNGREPIEWVVLSVEDDRIILLSEHILMYKEYHNEGCYVTWKDCSLRNWLNTTFFDEAFSKTEKERIVETLVVNNYVWIDPHYEEPFELSEPDTNDMVYIPSIMDITNSEYGFCKNPYYVWGSGEINFSYKYSTPTMYALCEKGYSTEYIDEDHSWMLRHSNAEACEGGAMFCATWDINHKGIPGSIIAVNRYEDDGIRPMISISIKDNDRLLTPVLKLKKYSDGIRLTTKNISNAESYRVYIKAEGEKKYILYKTIKNTGKNKSIITITDLQPGNYCFKVRAYIGNKKSKYSKVKKIIID